MNWVEYGWVPAGDWNLPDEFVHPDAFAFTSDRAQFILEQGGYAGYGRLHFGADPASWSRYRRLQGRRFGFDGYGLSWDEWAGRVALGE